jgi:hypothetical protein
MKKARTLFPQFGNNLWTRLHPLGKSCALPGSPGEERGIFGGVPQRRKTPWLRGSRSSSRGSVGSGPLAERLVKAGREAERASRKQACDGLKSPRRARRGRVSARMYRPLQPVDPRARDRGVRAERIGIMPSIAAPRGSHKYAAPVRREPIWSSSDEARLA